MNQLQKFFFFVCLLSFNWLSINSIFYFHYKDIYFLFFVGQQLVVIIVCAFVCIFCCFNNVFGLTAVNFFFSTKHKFLINLILPFFFYLLHPLHRTDQMRFLFNSIDAILLLMLLFGHQSFSFIFFYRFDTNEWKTKKKCTTIGNCILVQYAYWLLLHAIPFPLRKYTKRVSSLFSIIF